MWTSTPEHLHYDVRYLLRANHERFVVSDESIALGWFTLEEIETLVPSTDESVLRLARKAQGAFDKLRT